MSDPSDSPILTECLAQLAKIKQTCEKAIAQVSDEQLNLRINPHQNSIAVIMQHLAGNMVSRFTDFLTSDGEKPNRNREGEFEEKQLSRDELMQLWENGWAVLNAALQPLADADLQRTVIVRKEPHTIFAAILRQISHYASHMGHIMLIAKHHVGEKWQYITIPPGGTAAFNASKGL